MVTWKTRTDEITPIYAVVSVHWGCFVWSLISMDGPASPRLVTRPVYRLKHHNVAHSGAIIGAKGKAMRASVTLDDDLLKRAHEYTGLTERAELLREALKSIIAREAGRRLLALAGSIQK